MRFYGTCINLTLKPKNVARHYYTISINALFCINFQSFEGEAPSSV